MDSTLEKNLQQNIIKVRIFEDLTTFDILKLLKFKWYNENLRKSFDLSKLTYGMEQWFINKSILIQI